MPDPNVKMRRMDDDWMTAEQAAHALGVTRATLYAYVSRGLVRSAPASGTQHSRYRRGEVERLAVQRESARKPALVARASLAWGRPVLNSELTLIEARRLYYRGRDAIELSQHATLEDVAALSWSGRRWCCAPTMNSTHRVSRPVASRRRAPRSAPASPPAWPRCPAAATVASPRRSNPCGTAR